MNLFVDAFILIFSGLSGLIFFRNDYLILLISFEVLFLGINVLTIYFSIFHSLFWGMIISLILVCLTGSESSLGLGLMLNLYRDKGVISVSSVPVLKG